MKLYWDDLKGPKYALFLPNADHDLDDGREKALVTIALFARLNAAQTPLPQLEWSFRRTGNQRSVKIRSSLTPDQTLLWSAQSEDLDFRDESWSSRPLNQLEDGAWEGMVTAADSKHVAMYVEMQFNVDGVPYSLCSLVERN